MPLSMMANKAYQCDSRLFATSGLGKGLASISIGYKFEPYSSDSKARQFRSKGFQSWGGKYQVLRTIHIPHFESGLCSTLWERRTLQSISHSEECQCPFAATASLCCFPKVSKIWEALQSAARVNFRQQRHWKNE